MTAQRVESVTDAENASAPEFDPLDDTPRCPRELWRNPNQCEDINNLMFPYAGRNHSTLTDNQGFVLHANPLIK